MGADVGHRAVVGEAIAAAAGDLAAAQAANEGEQPELFAIPTRFLGVREDHSAGIEAVARAGAQRSAGRPPGAVNKSTAKCREWLLAKGVHPASQIMRWMMHTPESLALELKCTPLEAFRELRGMWEGLLPYFVPKMVPVDDQGNAVPFFQMILGGAGGAVAGSGAVPPWLAQVEQNQGVIDATPAVSHGVVSHGASK